MDRVDKNNESTSRATPTNDSITAMVASDAERRTSSSARSTGTQGTMLRSDTMPAATNPRSNPAREDEPMPSMETGTTHEEGRQRPDSHRLPPLTAPHPYLAVAYGPCRLVRRTPFTAIPLRPVSHPTSVISGTLSHPRGTRNISPLVPRQSPPPPSFVPNLEIFLDNMLPQSNPRQSPPPPSFVPNLEIFLENMLPQLNDGHPRAATAPQFATTNFLSRGPISNPGAPGLPQRLQQPVSQRAAWPPQFPPGFPLTATPAATPAALPRTPGYRSPYAPLGTMQLQAQGLTSNELPATIAASSSVLNTPNTYQQPGRGHKRSASGTSRPSTSSAAAANTSNPGEGSSTAGQIPDNQSYEEIYKKQRSNMSQMDHTQPSSVSQSLDSPVYHLRHRRTTFSLQRNITHMLNPFTKKVRPILEFTSDDGKMWKYTYPNKAGVKNWKKFKPVVARLNEWNNEILARRLPKAFPRTASAFGSPTTYDKWTELEKEYLIVLILAQVAEKKQQLDLKDYEDIAKLQNAEFASRVRMPGVAWASTISRSLMIEGLPVSRGGGLVKQQGTYPMRHGGDILSMLYRWPDLQQKIKTATLQAVGKAVVFDDCDDDLSVSESSVEGFEDEAEEWTTEQAGKAGAGGAGLEASGKGKAKEVEVERGPAEDIIMKDLYDADD